MDLSTIPTRYWMGLVLLVVAGGYTAWQNKDTIWAWIKTNWGIGSTTNSTDGSNDPDVLDMIAAKRLALRFKTSKCKEGQDAMQVVMTHFFHTDEV